MPPVGVAGVLLALLSFASPGAVKVTPDVVYGTGEVRSPHPGRKELLLDLYEPARGPGSTRYPGVVLLHPGAWLRGDRRTPPSMADLCRDLATRGFVCASIDYRLQGDDPPGAGASLFDRTIEASVSDAELAVRWMIANAARHGVDPTLIAVGGASAGAGTALLLAYGDRGKSLPIRAALDFWGGMQTSQLFWIERGKPALLIVHGTADEITDFSRAQALADRAKKAGVAWELVPVPGGRHNPPLAPYFDRIARFLAAQMRGSDLNH